MYRFEPLLKQTLWGGDKIIPFKHLDVQMENVGESWEISGVEGSETVVAEGEHKGKSLNELVSKLKGKLVGEENYQRFGNEFPLLIKFIDARQVRQRCGMCSIPTEGHNSTTDSDNRSPRSNTDRWWITTPSPMP